MIFLVITSRHARFEYPTKDLEIKQAKSLRSLCSTLTGTPLTKFKLEELKADNNTDIPYERYQIFEMKDDFTFGPDLLKLDCPERDAIYEVLKTNNWQRVDYVEPIGGIRLHSGYEIYNREGVEAYIQLEGGWTWTAKERPYPHAEAIANGTGAESLTKYIETLPIPV